uniref:Uncharacterized protein n=1 Tax=Coccidioides posadasii RMSCC 3488 TaxID=454284 RepID=A0A0J6F8Q3_COCPO|nr:hypothetical protein CPAG_05727 [Coccidioides posadasii RMSCC 3488]
MEVGQVWPRAIQGAGLDSFKSRNPRNRNMPYEGNTIEPPTRNYSRWRVGSLVLGGSQTHINGHEAQAACHWWRHQGTGHFELQNPRDKDRQTKLTDRHAHAHTHTDRHREREREFSGGDRQPAMGLGIQRKRGWCSLSSGGGPAWRSLGAIRHRWPLRCCSCAGL